MNTGPHPSSGRLGWLLAALLFGVLAGGGIAWALISRRAENPSVVIYQMPTPTASSSPDDSGDHPASTLRRHHRTVHSADDLPSFLEGAQPTPAVSPTPNPDLAAGIDGGSSAESPSSSPGAVPTATARQTVLVDGIAITEPPSIPVPTPRPSGRVIYDAGSTGVDDSISLAIEELQKYLKGKGFTVREDTWGGELIAGKAKAISHQLFKGNDYWFCMGCATAGTTIRVRLYDSDGNPVDTNYWQHEESDGSSAAAEIQCQHTGTYFIVLYAEKAPEDRIPWGVVFAYR